MIPWFSPSSFMNFETRMLPSPLPHAGILLLLPRHLWQYGCLSLCFSNPSPVLRLGFGPMPLTEDSPRIGYSAGVQGEW